MARLATSLVILRDEANQLAPARSKRSDGWIGDAAHRSRPSRHNPNEAGVVCALDLTHDPANGFDVHAIARELVRHPHPDLEYVISNRQVAKRRNGFRWEAYTGANGHTVHAHFAVGRGPDGEPTPTYDTRQTWGLAPTPAPIPPPTAPQAPDDFRGRVMALPTLKQGASGQYVRNMQGLLVANGANTSVDGAFGPATASALKAWQGRAGLSADGICGPATWSRLVGV